MANNEIEQINIQRSNIAQRIERVLNSLKDGSNTDKSGRIYQELVISTFRELIALLPREQAMIFNESWTKLTEDKTYSDFTKKCLGTPDRMETDSEGWTTDIVLEKGIKPNQPFTDSDLELLDELTQEILSAFDQVTSNKAV
jgi:hypothetical protein